MIMKKAVPVIFLVLFLTLAVYAQDIRITDAEAQFSSMKPDIGAVFMKIENRGIDDSIIGARVSIPDVIVELHDVKDGAMVKVERIFLPGKSTVELKKGGLHIMLFNLPIEVKEGDEFTLTLILEKAGEKDVKVRFQKSHMHHH